MRIYALTLLLLSSVIGVAQDCTNTLFGKIIDSHDGTTLVGATLVVMGTNKTVQTDLNGNYIIQNLCNQNYTIQISHPECLTKEYVVKLFGHTKKNLYLEHHLEELNEVTITGNAYGKKSNSLFENKISKTELERFNSGSIGDALNSLSGVSSLNTGSTIVKPLVNGLHSSRVVIINNGVRMEDQEWGAEHAPNVDINAIDNMTLIKGAGALQYGGDAIGGVIVAEASKVPVKDSLYGKTLSTMMSNGQGATLTSQLTKSYQNGWYAVVQGTLKRLGDFEAPDYILSNTGVFELGASLRTGFNNFNHGMEAYYSYFKNEIGILRASHLGGASDQIRAIESDRPLIINDFTHRIDIPKQDVTHHIFRLNGFKRFEKIGKLSFQYDFQNNNRLEFDIRRGDDEGKASLDLELKTHTLKLDLDSNISDLFRLKTGMSGRYQNNFADPNTGIRRLIPDYDKYDFGVYSIASYDLNDNWLVELGGRFDYAFMDALKFYRNSFWESRNYDQEFPELVVEEFVGQVLTNPEFKFNNFSATAGVTYDINEDHKLFFNYSLASRAPNPSEVFSEGLHHSASRIELGDLRFVSETARKLSLTFQRDHDVFWFSISPYVNTIKDFILIEPTEVQQTIRGNFQVWEYRQTNARLWGVDIDASYAFAKNLWFDHQLSIVKGYDRTRNESLINMPPVNTKNEIRYENARFNNLQLTLQSEYVFRQNEFPDNNFEVFNPETQTSTVVDVSTPPGAYHLLNFNSSMDFEITEKSILTVGLGVTNILNTSYRNYLNRLRYYADDLGRNFLLNIKINY